MNALHIRKATNQDIGAIMEIERDSFHENIMENEEVFRQRISIYNDGFLVLLSDERVIGYITSELWKYKDNVEKSRFALGHNISKYHKIDGDELYISSFGILNKYRNHGYGSLLLNRLISNHSGIKSIILLVSHEFKKAKLMYKNKGFNLVARIDRAFKYDDNNVQEGLVLRKTIRRAF